MGVGCVYGERRDVYRILLRKPEEKRPLGRPSCRWEDNFMLSSGSGMWRHGLDKAGSI
jgi:hypothetical protein